MSFVCVEYFLRLFDVCENIMLCTNVLKRRDARSRGPKGRERERETEREAARTQKNNDCFRNSRITRVGQVEQTHGIQDEEVNGIRDIQENRGDRNNILEFYKNQ